ncbi:hypothetical protein L873DRAFT_1823054 [Choiromyces venosus 120613-1]|uniref:Uncharacterized protein n=1 Tax=Choiromyces venosus 120613-1 TaxID=1336337 RepID=A0A3N4IT16_9PEZI|nr:hypothetical protein L873DRAFT_1823054 [Choiromyces venosus 120613-1]
MMLLFGPRGRNFDIALLLLSKWATLSALSKRGIQSPLRELATHVFTPLSVSSLFSSKVSLGTGIFASRAIRS